MSRSRFGVAGILGLARIDDGIRQRSANRYLKEQLTIFIKGGGFVYCHNAASFTKNTGDGIGDTSTVDSTLNFIDYPNVCFWTPLVGFYTKRSR